MKSKVLFAAIFISPLIAHAHSGHFDGGFVSGAAHPFGGLDHLLAMVAVGLWAAQLGGRSRWVVPASFVVLMTIGGIAGMSGVPLPGLEQGIAASVLILGIFVALAACPRLIFGAGIVALFAVFHGQAHGAEMPVNASGLLYGCGFVLATVLLHASGVATGMLTLNFQRPVISRFAGAAVAVCGLAMWTGLL